MADDQLSNDLREELRNAWVSYLAELGPIRGQLHGYCRKLTHNVWDAEDLLQETIVRGFSALSTLYREVRAPRAYLFRIATNVWTDRIRRSRTEAAALAEFGQGADGEGAEDTATDLGDAAVLLFEYLAPQERAAVLLKEGFGMTLRQIAEALGTTEGAVQSALHRGRSRLKASSGTTPPRRAPSKDLVSRFVELYNGADKEGLVELVLDNAEIDHVGLFHHHGAEAKRTGFFSGTLGAIPHAPDAGFESQRAELMEFEGEPIVLIFRTRSGREILEQLLRLEEEDGKVSRLRGYGSCRETMAEVSGRLGLPPSVLEGSTLTLDRIESVGVRP